jgi:hypothetical protein
MQHEIEDNRVGALRNDFPQTRFPGRGESTRELRGEQTREVGAVLFLIVDDQH